MPSISAISSTLASAAPYLPMSAHLLASALAPIYAGAHASLSRPSSAARRKRRSKATTADTDSSDDEGTKMEALAPSDALLFPLTAGCTLGALYLLIQYGGAAWLNRVLGAYMGLMAVAGVGSMGADALRVLGGLLWPDVYADRGVWRVSQEKRTVEGPGEARRQPLPGWLGRIRVGDTIAGVLWEARGWCGRRYAVSASIGGRSVKLEVSLRAAMSTLVAAGVVAYAYFISTPWYLTNLQGFALVYSALQLMSTGTFATGSLILVALFFYDIYFVFYTPLMVSVATELDVPIKLLIPRPESEGKSGLAMLGLGDIVLPGIMMGLSLRFDLYMSYLRKQKKGRGKQVTKATYVPVTTTWGERVWTWGSNGDKTIAEALPSFSKTYFYASVVGYTIGMGTTLIVMHVYKHAQPALLYLVPGVLSSIWLTALIRGEIQEMWQYSEIEEEEAGTKDDAAEDEAAAGEQVDAKTGLAAWLSNFFGESSLFGHAKTERNAKKLEDYVAKKVQVSKATGSKKGSSKTTKPKGPWFSLSVRRASAKVKRERPAKSRSPGTVSKRENKAASSPEVESTGIEANANNTRVTRSTRSRKE